MDTDVLKTFDNLQEELNKARDNLKGLNDNIRRIIGRDPLDANLRTDRKRGFNDARRNEFGQQHDRQRNRDGSPLQQKRRQNETKSVFSRLSGPPTRDEEDNGKPKVFSRVIKELPTRQEIVAAQGVDEQSRARNRRMFGSLLGTLQKFCQEESRLKPKEEKKAQIEKKLDELAKKERENLKMERQTLFSDRKRTQHEIRMIEIKMNRMQEQSAWEESKKPLVNFIMTKTKPHIYYKPKIMCKKTETKLSESKAELAKLIEKKRQDIYEEIASLEARFKNSQSGNMELAEKNDRLSKHDRSNGNEDDDQDSSYNNSENENENEHENENENENENDVNNENKSNIRSRLGDKIEDNDHSTEVDFKIKTEHNVDNLKMVISVINDQVRDKAIDDKED